MALGDITDAGWNKAIELLASATATNSPPSDPLDGLSMNELQQFGKMPEVVSLLLYSTAGSDTMTVTGRMWGYHPASAVWAPLGVGAGATKGIINDGAAIDETDADAIQHAEPLDLPGHFTRLYLEITAIGGTSTAVTAQLVVGAN